MKKKCFIAIAIIVYAITAMANEVKTVNLTFNKQQFSFVKNSVGATEITMNGGVFGYDEVTSLPAFPLVAINVRVPNGMSFDSVTETTTEELLFNDIIVAANHPCIPTSFVGELPQTTLPKYSNTTYPNKNVQYVTTSIADGCTVLRFLVCPFKYNVQKKELYLTKNISLNIILKDIPLAQAETNTVCRQNLGNIINSQVINATEFNDEPLDINAIDISIGGIKILPPEYVIITSEALAPYFEELSLWKKQKGLNSKIVKIEEIKNLYPELSTQLAIKTFLQEQYKNQKLRYVLLGGDDTVVPVQYCYYRSVMEGGNNVTKYTPSDLYYACFGGNFEWDGNGNGTCGEITDNVDFTPSIFVTRAPVRTIADVNAFVFKTIDYEKNPIKTLTSNTWGNDMLIAGDSITNKYNWPSPYQSDTDYKGRKLYNTYIAPYWNGTVKMYFDTSTDFPGGEGYNLSTENFQTQLSKGYAFVDYMAHGSETAWHLEKNWFYNVEEAELLENSGYSIIVTGSCLTNAFDDVVDWKGDINDPCLSEAFIRNPNSGIVAYYGCSREGWESFDYNTLGPSQLYKGEFYKKLFSNTFVNKNFGEIVAASKMERVPFCNYLGSNRYLQLGLNPIGDPEMPIYTTTPKRFSNIIVHYSKDGKSATIDTGVDSCKICIMSKTDNGESYHTVLNNVRQINHASDKIYSVCITKQNYIPYLATLLPMFPSTNTISKCTICQNGNILEASTQLSDDIKDAKIIISTASGLNQKEYTVSADNPIISADISNNPKGVHTVTLIVNGEKADSISIIK